MPKVSKRNKFKGTPSWRKRNLPAQSNDSLPTNMITNVNNTSEAELDEDSSGNGPQPTIITASERKLQSFSEQKVEEESKLVVETLVIDLLIYQA
jgi:hypothetical protein